MQLGVIFVVLLEFVCCAIDGQTMYFLVTGDFEITVE